MRTSPLAAAGRVLLVVLALAAGCKDATGPSTGILRVSLTTTGVDIDTDGYSVSVDGGRKWGVAPNGSITLPSVEPGSHTVRLEELAANCSVEDRDGRSVIVVAGGEVTVAFAVSCVPRLGVITVITTTVGVDVDPDGYSASVDGGDGRSVGADGTLTFVGLSEGNHTVTLSGAATNCAIGETNPQPVSVTFAAPAVARFVVTCAAPVGSVRVTTVTSGRDPDPDGYTVEVRAGSGPFSASQPIGVNTSVTVPAIPVGDIAATLAGVAANCVVAGGATRQVAVIEGATADVAFDVTCAPLPAPALLPPLAFVRDEQIYLINPDGTGLVRLTTSGSNSAPAWSPDGRRIAFVSNRGGGYFIHVMNADGSNVVRRGGKGTPPNFQPTWSPDGRKIAFVGRQDGDAEIYVMSADDDGTSPVRLTNHPGDDIDPAWSPDGSKIAFASYRDGTLDVYTMSPDGSGVTRLTSAVPDRASYYKPAWSPDGSRIAFISERCSGYVTCPFADWWGYGDIADWSVEIANADGSGATVLETADLDVSFHISRPTWSPDGRTIALTRKTCAVYIVSGSTCGRYVHFLGMDGRVGATEFGGDSPSWRW